MIEGFAFIIIEGKDEGRGEIVSEPAIEFSQIDGGKAGIEVKSESSRVTGLTVGEASELFGIAEEKFNGLITNDKFCLTRYGELKLKWWRRPLRLRQKE